MSRKLERLEGQRFGRLLAVHLYPKRSSSGGAVYTCMCDCGRAVNVTGNDLKRGDTRACRAHRRAVALAHGHWVNNRPSPTYQSWAAMKRRCLSPKHEAYLHYAGRGITVCDRWRESFEAFLADMGERPEGTTLDRIDNDGNYEPGNCRWADWTTQANNRRRKRKMAA